jgi:lipopolysaccharide export system permease protein
MMFLLLMQFLILHVDKLIGKDIPLSIIIELIATNLAYMVVLAAPMAVLVASLMAFGKFSELNELTALRASGINPIKIIQPVLIASFILGIFLVWFSNSVLPEANSKARSLFMDIRVKKPGFDLKPNVFYDGIEGYTFLVREIDNETDSLFNVTLFQEPSNNRKRAYIRAERGFLQSEGAQGLTLILEDGEILRYLERNRQTRLENQEKTQFSKYRLTFDLSELEFSRSDPTGRSDSDRTMSAQAMSAVVDTLRLEVDSYTNKASDNTSFTHIYGEDNAQPFISSFDLNFRPDTVIQSNNELSRQQVVPDYFVLQFVEKDAHQRSVVDLARSNIEQDNTYFESTSSNVLWRLKRINKFLVEIHKKFSIPMACVVFVLLGAPIGMMTRKGNFGYAALISAIILTIYWVSIIQGEKLADRLFISPFLGMWAFNIVFSGVGILLILQLTTNLNLKRLILRRA